MDENRLFGWGLGTFHTCLFVLALVFLFYLSGSLGDLLSGLDTLSGFALFGALWASTTWSTRRAVTNIAARAGGILAVLENSSVSGWLIAQGLLWGAANGLAFFAVLIFFVLSSLFLRLSAFETPDLFGLVPYLLVGGIAAAFIGAVVGLLLAIVDSLLLVLFRLAGKALPAILAQTKE